MKKTQLMPIDLSYGKQNQLKQKPVGGRGGQSSSYIGGVPVAGFSHSTSGRNVEGSGPHKSGSGYPGQKSGRPSRVNALKKTLASF